MPAGRPTKYKPEMIQQVQAYIDNCPDVVPSLCGLAMELDIGESTLVAWKSFDSNELDKNDYPQFSEFQGMLHKLHSFQQREALNCGATGEWTVPIAKLVLAKHGYSDRLETDHTSKGERLSGCMPILSSAVAKEADAVPPRVD